MGCVWGGHGCGGGCVAGWLARARVCVWRGAGSNSGRGGGHGCASRRTGRQRSSARWVGGARLVRAGVGEPMQCGRWPGAGVARAHLASMAMPGGARSGTLLCACACTWLSRLPERGAEGAGGEQGGKASELQLPPASNRRACLTKTGSADIWQLASGSMMCGDVMGRWVHTPLMPAGLWVAGCF